MASSSEFSMLPNRTGSSREPVSPVAARPFPARTYLLLVPLVIPVFLCGVSMLAGGVPALTDMGFLILTITCVGYVGSEMFYFSQRFGVGGLVLFGGVLIWFCQDYMKNWFGMGASGNASPIPLGTVADAAFWHMLFIFCAAAGLFIPWGQNLQKLVTHFPEPSTKSFYFWLMIFLFITGLFPYLFFTSEPWYLSIFHAIIGGRSGNGVRWTVTRTGNVNYNWGAYLAVLIQLGTVGAQFAVVYAVIIAETRFQQILSWSIWLFWLAIAFGSGTRGRVAFIGLPVLVLVYLKYHAQIASTLKRISVKAYVVAGAIALCLLILVQIQGNYRDVGFSDVSLSGSEVVDLKGNTMFSEGLLGYEIIPSHHKFFYSHFPGEGLIRPIPQTLYQFIIGPIPRALWHNKPIDPVWRWYNEVVTGSSNIQGTTIAQGLVGYWYFAFGPWGVIEGGILFGWVIVFAERCLQASRGRPMSILLSLALLTWMFRNFRGVNYNGLYPVIIGGVVLWILITAHRSMYGAD